MQRLCQGTSVCPKSSLKSSAFEVPLPETQSAWRRSVMYEEDRKCRYLAQETRPKSDENIPEWPGVEGGPEATVNSSHGCFLGPRAPLISGGQNLQKGRGAQ